MPKSAIERLQDLQKLSPAFSKLKIPTAAIEKVEAAQERKRRSTGRRKAGFAAPSAVVDIIQNPIIGGAGAVVDLWTGVLGTREQKVDAALDYYPINQEAKDTVQATIDYSKNQSDPNAAYWGERVLPITGDPVPDIIPDIGGIGKDIKSTLLLGGLVLAGVYLAGKIIGRK